MSFPEQVPVFTKDDILISETEYENGEVRSSIGWLKHLFLYHFVDDDSFEIRAEDRQNYKKVLDIWKNECKIGVKADINTMHSFEEKTSKQKQAAILNKVCRKLGYTDINGAKQ